MAVADSWRQGQLPSWSSSSSRQSYKEFHLLIYLISQQLFIYCSNSQLILKFLEKVARN